MEFGADDYRRTLYLELGLHITPASLYRHRSPTHEGIGTTRFAIDLAYVLLFTDLVQAI